LECHLYDRVVVAGIIAKLHASCRNFATSLKHKREDISAENLITTLNMEEKARANDALDTSATIKNGASANIIVGKKTYYNKNKGKKLGGGKPKKTVEHVLCVVKKDI
jgi:hypothetical protein